MSAYSAAVLADNPLQYWRLADPPLSRILNDIGSARSPLEDHVLAQTFNACGYSGPVSDGGSWYTDRGSELTSYGGIALSLPATLELWFWAWGAVNLNFIAAFDNTGNSGIELIAGSLHAVATCGGANVTGATSASDRAWHHLVAAADSSTLVLYLDGVSQGSSSTAGVVLANHNLLVGQTPGRAVNFEGFVAEVAHYGAKLPAARVLAHFNAADQVTAPPVFRAAGGGNQYPPPPAPAAIEDLIVKYVAKVFQNSP